jgi:hypothetical protein
MRKPALAALTALACVAMLTACQEDEPVDLTPLPTVADPPYLCGYIPQKAVELMTGVRNPVARGQFDLTIGTGPRIGTCVIRRPGDDQLNAMVVHLSSDGSHELIKEELNGGASPLPEIVPGSIGAYFKDPSGTDNAAFARLVRGKAELGIALEIGVEGRDNAADVVALMKLIAPKLTTDASAPSPSPSPTPSPSGE